MERYRVVKDLQGGIFGTGRDYTIEQWRKQAIEWCYMDENDEMAEYMYMLKSNKVIEVIAWYWDLQFRKVRKDKKKFEKWELEEYEDETLEEFFNARFGGLS